MRTSKHILMAAAAMIGLSGVCRIEDELSPAGAGGAAEVEAPSLRDQLTAAFSADSASQGSADPTPAPAAAAPPVAAAAPAASATDPTGAQVRDGQGRFAKPGEQVQNNTEPKAAQPGAEPQAQAETIRPPASWSATAKADFAALPAHIQQEVVKREQDIEAGKAQWDQKAARFNRLDAVLAPRQERLRLAGISEEQALTQLFAAQDMLETRPVDALLYLARSSGVTVQHLMQAMGGQQQSPQGQAQLHPVIQQLAQEVQTLKQGNLQQQQAAQQQGQSAAQREIEAFAADPANIYFPNVREQMGHLIRSGQVPDLKAAYEAAIWASAEIRPLLIRDQQQTSQAEQQRQQQQRAAQARHAGGSVTGSPVPGSTGPGAGPADTLRGELERAFAGAQI